MKPYKLITAIISYLLVFQFLHLPEASCAQSCIRGAELQQEATTGEPAGISDLATGILTPPPMSAIARW